MTASRPQTVNAADPRSSSRTEPVPGPPSGQGHIPIVAIGASAGGLDACRTFLKALAPETGMAFIFVQHLDPAHHSLIVDLLTGHTALAVTEAVDGAVIERDHFYVIAPGTYLSVEDGALRVARPAAHERVRLPFNALLNSLAAEKGIATIAVILSGTGSDGSAALRGFKARGGLVVAQSPEEAAYDGMPQSAVMTGLVDHILPISKIPAALTEYVRMQATGPSETPAIPVWPSAGLSDIIDLLRTKTPHDFRSYKPGTLKRRVERRMGLASVPAGDLARYCELLARDHKELEALSQDLLINVTSFFRDEAIFNYLGEKTVPDVVRSHSADTPIRVWIAGCSSGEEAYSIAILFSEAIAAIDPHKKLQVFASDVDADAIATAREGVYPATIATEVSEARLARFFAREERGYRVLPDLRSLVVFTEQDVLADPPFSRIDMVSCRNLLIYLMPDAQAKVISLFHFALRENGILLLGSSETVGKADGRFAAVSRSRRIFRHIGRSRPGELMFSLNPTESIRTLPRSGIQAAPSHQNALAELCRQMVMDRYAPAAVLINSKNECVYSLGSIDRYLSVAPGYPNHDILSMVSRPLQTKLRSAIQRAGQQRTRIVTTGRAGKAHPFSIHVEPIASEGQAYYLICFLEEQTVKPARKSDPEASTDDTRVRELESELEATKAELNGAIRNLEISADEQKAINEEEASFNEEYQSTNEELLTSKEELQSINEELTALNGQLQETLERQRTTANDLQNVLYSTEFATLFLDPDLNIRFFTPSTRSLFNVIPGDIGRPLADLSSLTVDATLLIDAAAVLKNHMPLENEIETRNGTWYMRRILPYLGEDDVVEGVVITFVDVTEQRHIADALQIAKRQADFANAAKSRFLAAASHDLRQPLQTLNLLQGLLARTVEGEKQQGLVARVGDTLGAMADMLNALLDINQIEIGIVKAEMADFPIRDLLTPLKHQFATTAQATCLALRVVDCGLTVRTDPRLLEQMVRNLLSNAFKYTKTGKILLGCRRRGKMLSIEIWDTGIGIPATELQSIFDEYHQLNNDARERSKGLGLGLSIVQRLGNLLGHRIRVKSRPSKGSMFAIDVEIVRTGEAILPEKPQAPFAEGLSDLYRSTASLLLIEDDPEVRDLLAQVLTEAGHKVVVAADGPIALTLAARHEEDFDLILSDYNVPGGLNGMQILGTLRERAGYTIPAIILTGDISRETLSDVAGENLLRLAKPVVVADVENAIQTILAGKSNVPAPLPRDVPANSARTVYVIDDDEELLETLRLALEKHGLFVETYVRCEDFLRDRGSINQGCVLVDGYLPGMDGLGLLHRLKEQGRSLPSIMMTGNSDVTMAVNAMKAGASDFIEKPVAHAELLASIDRALEIAEGSTRRTAWNRDAARLIASLTARQKEIMTLVLAGQPSKNIAADLGISQRTVENHRASIMTKTGSRSLPALARLAVAANLTAFGSDVCE